MSQKVLTRRLSHALFNQNFCQYVLNFYRWKGVRSPTQMSQLLMSQSGYGGGVSGLIGTMSLNTFFFYFEGIPYTIINFQNFLTFYFFSHKYLRNIFCSLTEVNSEQIFSSLTIKNAFQKKRI